MSYPEGTALQNDTMQKQEEENKGAKKMFPEGSASIELASFKNPKTWKKSISNFFRNQLRSSKSNDGDATSDGQESYSGKDISPDQKWQSLGKIFRRNSLAEPWNSNSQQGESSTHSKRLAVRKVLSSYFGKYQKPATASQSADNE